jgi:tol-pal system protein YbgF
MLHDNCCTAAPTDKEGVSPMQSAPFKGRILGAMSAALLVVASASSAFGQGVQGESLPEVKGGQGKAQKSAGAPAGGGDAALRERVEQLEGQLVDLQVVIGTLESLARTGGVSSTPARSEASGGGVSAGDRGRLDSMETQIRALTAQVEQLAAEMRAQGQRRSDAGAAAPGGFAADAPQTSRFGSTTVTSDNADPIGALAAGDPAPQGPPASRFPQQTAPQGPAPPTTYGSESLPPPGGGGQFAAIDPAPAGGGSPKQLYETAYGHLLQQDYGEAQAGFREFLKVYPQDSLAPNALYWLGESHYVQRNYADAAEAFDLVITAYGTSGKAADAQLKRGMALAQLGKRQDACAALRGVASKYPSAPASLKAKADGERQRIGCP